MTIMIYFGGSLLRHIDFRDVAQPLLKPCLNTHARTHAHANTHTYRTRTPIPHTHSQRTQL